MSGTVKVIFHPQHPGIPIVNKPPTRRVAIYARVSTDSDGQMSSVEAQKDYYSKLVDKRVDWVFGGLFADTGISGTGTQKRAAFLRMMQAAERHEFDLIVTKSISRFARNTVDSLTAIRRLKELGIEVFFEKENVWTFDAKGELMLTILASVAQEESRSISENVTWGKRKRFADGKYSVPYTRFLGYDKGADGTMVINPEEAKTIKRLYHMFLLGMSPYHIGKLMTDMQIPSPGGKLKWNASAIRSILTNEKYKGDALIQKEFTISYITKAKKKNEGELPRYYVTNGHEAIIPRPIHDYVQDEISRRNDFTVGKFSGIRPFSGKIICDNCGAAFRCSCWHPTSYNDWVWECSSRWRDKKCGNIHIYDEQFKKLLEEAFQQALYVRKQTIESLKQMIIAIPYLSTGSASSIMTAIVEKKALHFKQADALLAVKEIRIQSNSKMRVLFIDDSEVTVHVPQYSPRKGYKQ